MASAGRGWTGSRVEGGGGTAPARGASASRKELPRSYPGARKPGVPAPERRSWERTAPTLQVHANETLQSHYLIITKMLASTRVNMPQKNNPASENNGDELPPPVRSSHAGSSRAAGISLPRTHCPGPGAPPPQTRKTRPSLRSEWRHPVAAGRRCGPWVTLRNTCRRGRGWNS